VASIGDGEAQERLRAALRVLVDHHGYKKVARRASCSESTLGRILNGRTGRIDYGLALEILAWYENEPPGV
jgi:transcriptional regulator with XRE-family HTH domain